MQIIRIRDLDILIIRSNRKTASLEIRPDGQILLRAPQRAPVDWLKSFAAGKYDWLVFHRRLILEKAQERAAEKAAHPVQKLSMEDIRRLADEALADIPARTRRFAPLVGVSYNKITIRNQKSKWGSCSSKGNLNFNCLLMLAPDYARDYVVVHELCHRLEMNHSPRFWAEVERVLPDYRRGKTWLKENGADLMERMIPDL